MSDAATQPDPALPNTPNSTKVPTNLPTSADMPAAGAVSRSLPSSPKALLAQSDEFIDRLTKLIRTTAGLGSLLSTLSYSLYIAAYLDLNSPTRAQIIESISHLIGRTPLKASAPTTLQKGVVAPAAPISRFAPYIGLLNDTRFTIRLTALLPMIALLKGLLKSPPKDPVLRALARVQVSCYLVFTFIENLWFLASKNLISPTTANRLGGQLALLQWSCRPWLVAILCDFARLAREAQLADSQRQQSLRSGEKSAVTPEQEAVAAKKWNAELFSAISYFPMAVHYSVDGGIGLNTLMVGLSGLFGGSTTFLKLWASTKE